MRAFAVLEPSQVAGARHGALAAARELGLAEEDAGRAALIVTELGTNLCKHAGGGEILIGASATAIGACLDILSLDKGAGIANLDMCIADGYSTAGTRGTGLGAIRRQATTFAIYSPPGRGAAVHARVCAGRTQYRARERTCWAVLSRPVEGEDVCGDSCSVRETGRYFAAMVADGLGHGQFAAAASRQAAATFQATRSPEADELVESIHGALRATRGAAVAVTSIDFSQRMATFCGIGNIAGSLSADGAVRKLTSLNGTAGLVARGVRGFQYPIAGETLLIMHSDGVSANWALDRYPSLAHQEPMLIAALLYRDFGRARDDALILVARVAP